MALGATGRHIDLLAVRRVACHRNAPGAGFGRLGQRGEISGETGNLRITELFFGEGRHDAPGLAHRLAELRRGEAAPRQVRAKSALAVAAMAVLAEELVAGP